MGGFLFPEGISKRVDVNSLNDAKLLYYHDQLHVLWKKLEEGYKFDWTFLEIANLHSDIVREMGARDIRHYSPVNELDKVQFFSQKD